jgi:hypothetical protein
MAVQIMPDRDRPKFANSQPTPDEAKSALVGYTAYFGTYTVASISLRCEAQLSIPRGVLGCSSARRESL